MYSPRWSARSATLPWHVARRLPCSSLGFHLEPGGRLLTKWLVQFHCTRSPFWCPFACSCTNSWSLTSRSEERRVGKECSSKLRADGEIECVKEKNVHAL